MIGLGFLWEKTANWGFFLLQIFRLSRSFVFCGTLKSTRFVFRLVPLTIPLKIHNPDFISTPSFLHLQILTGSSDGSIHVLYSPLNSTRGITLAVTRAPKQRAPDDFSSSTFLDRPIITPHSLPMFKDDYGDGSAGGRSGKRKRERERHDPLKTMKPSKHPNLLFGRRHLLSGRIC